MAGLQQGQKLDKIWRGAIRKAVSERLAVEDADGKVRKIKALNLLAMSLVKTGLTGDVSALKEIGDRLDGKPAQAIAIKGDPDSPVIFNLRLGDGIAPKVIDGGAVEVLPDALTGPLVAIATQDEES